MLEITLSDKDAAAFRPGLMGLTDDDLLQVYHAVKYQLRPGAVCVELGTWRGRSLVYAASVMRWETGEVGSVYGIDPYRFPPAPDDPEGCTIPWAEAYSGILDYATKEELEVIYLARVRDVEAARMFEPKSLDLVCLDAVHTFDHTLRACKKWLRLVRPGGFLIGHDYSAEFPGVVDAVNGLFSGKLQIHRSVWIHQVDQGRRANSKASRS